MSTNTNANSNDNGEDINEQGDLPDYSPSTRSLPKPSTSRPLISHQDTNIDNISDNEVNEPRPEYQKPIYSRDKSKRLKTKELIKYKGLLVYNLASIAYLDSLNKENSN